MDWERIREMNQHNKAILYVILTGLGFSLMSLFVRLAGDLPTMEKALFRNAVAALVALSALFRSKEKLHLKQGSLPFLFLRSCFGTAGLIINFYVIDHLNIADANILNKLSPFFAILMSMIILHEIPKYSDFACVIVALTGAAFVVHPTKGLASLPALIGVLGGFCAGTAYTFVRKLRLSGERGPVIVLFFSVFSLIVCIPGTVINFQPMQPIQLLFLILAGCSAALGQFSVTKAYALAPAKEISIFDYSQVLFAALWGFFFFGERPDLFSAIGYALILGAAIYHWKK